MLPKLSSSVYHLIIQHSGFEFFYIAGMHLCGLVIVIINAFALKITQKSDEIVFK